MITPGIRDVATFPATAAGYRQLLRWLRRLGDVVRVGVEGTGSYGVGLTRYLAREDVEVVEVNRPNRQTRRRRGKTDTVDAEAAARAALNGDPTVAPTTHDGIVESIRALRIAFCSIRNTRTRVANQLRDLIICAPDQLRSELEPLDTPGRVERAARFRPGDLTDATEGTKPRCASSPGTTKTSPRISTSSATASMRSPRQANPALRNTTGVGADVASILLIPPATTPND